MTLKDFARHAATLAEASSEVVRMPALFVGHGSPMNGIEDNIYTRGWSMLGESLPRPTAILCISAHWLTQGTLVHSAKTPRTIHDFWGFPKELYDLRYSCPGSPEYAKEVQELLPARHIESDSSWGIDHGTWIVLRRMFPLADIPVFQMSMDLSQSPAFHYQLGRELGALRKNGVLIIGSGNLVHNLGRIAWEEGAKPYDWAIEFDERAKNFLTDHNHDALIDYGKLGAEAVLSIPTPEHYWPMLYALGAGGANVPISFPVEGIAHGSVSMRAIKIG